MAESRMPVMRTVTEDELEQVRKRSKWQAACAGMSFAEANRMAAETGTFPIHLLGKEALQMVMTLSSQADFGPGGEIVQSNGSASLGMSPQSGICLGPQKFEGLPEAIQTALLNYAREGPLGRPENTAGLALLQGMLRDQKTWTRCFTNAVTEVPAGGQQHAEAHRPRVPVAGAQPPRSELPPNAAVLQLPGSLDMHEGQFLGRIIKGTAPLGPIPDGHEWEPELAGDPLQPFFHGTEEEPTREALRRALRLPANAILEAIVFNALDKGAARRDTAFPEWCALLDTAFPTAAPDAVIPATVAWVARDQYVSAGHSLVLARLVANSEHLA
ncbi:MAG: hypothetical protein VXW31_00695, partial [Planctomycetota bacterium]|nr:hypothetical protein [Planctomycetota bacterium]